MWIFGYGSLMWRPGFSYVERTVATLSGYRRVFWQASPDHRGTPERPGRVVTLADDGEAQCAGVAFRLDEVAVDRTLADLDDRERGGYVRQRVALRRADGGCIEGLTYVARPDNPHYLGEACLQTMVHEVLASSGESGANSDYVLRLDEELQRLGIVDRHATALASALRATGLT